MKAAARLAGLWAAMLGGSAAAATLFVGGTIWTADPDRPFAAAVVVQGERIVYVGDVAGAEAVAGEAATVVSLHGRTLLPGFVDSHTHPGIAGLLESQLQLVGTRTIAEVQAALKAYAEAHPGEGPIFGFGFPSALNTAVNVAGVAGPHRQDLDAAVPDRPVMLLALDAHSAWLNSRALAVADIAKETPDPLPGVYYYQRDAQGEPTGWLVESGAFWPLLPVFGVGTEADFRTAYRAILPRLSAMGITSVFDAGIPGDALLRNALAALAGLDQAGQLPLRYRASAYLSGPKTTGEALAATIKALRQSFASHLARPEATPSGLLDIRTAKVANDGTIEGKTAALLAPYAGGGSGAVLLAAEPLGKRLSALRRAGLDAHVHAIGGRALRTTLDAVAQARQAVPVSDARVTVAHAMLVAAADLRRLRPLDVTLQTTPHWAHDLGGSLALYSRLLGDARGENTMRLRDFQAQAPLLTFGADHPATGLPFPQTSPLHGIEIGHTRRPPGTASGPRLPAADQRLPLEQLLFGYTAAGAEALRLDEVGAIAPGKQADLVVLGADLFRTAETAPHQIHAIDVDLTMLAGRVVFERKAE